MGRQDTAPGVSGHRQAGLSSLCGGSRFRNFILSRYHLEKSQPPQISCPECQRASVFLMLGSQSFRYFKGILIFLQIYSIFYFLLLSIYIVPTVRRIIF